MIKFPIKKYSKSNEYFADYINIKDLLLKKVDQKILLKIIQLISSTIKKRDIFSHVVMMDQPQQLNI